MQEIEIEICNDGKEKSYSWQLSINIYLYRFDSDDEPSYSNCFTLSNNLDITICDSSYDKLIENAFMELHRFRDKKYITEFHMNSIINLLTTHKEDIKIKVQYEGQNTFKIKQCIDPTELLYTK